RVHGHDRPDRADAGVAPGHARQRQKGCRDRAAGRQHAGSVRGAGGSLLFLSQADVVRLLDIDKLLEALAGAFVELSAGRTSVPPRIAARTASGGLLGAMPGYIAGVLEAKVVSVFPQNHARGLPSHQGLIALFDEDTGAPVSSVGGTFGPELDAQTIGAGTIFVESRDAVRQPPPAGAHELQGLRPESVTEIGEVIAATQPGRSAPDQLTVYKSSGHAVEDAAAARLVYERALAEGAGQRVSL